MSEEIQLVPEEYSLVSVAKVAESAFKLRKKVMEIPTDKNYIDVKPGTGFSYVKGIYMDDTFKRIYPIYETETPAPIVQANAWVCFTVTLKAYITPTIVISNPGSGGHRIQISKEYNDEIRRLKEAWIKTKKIEYMQERANLISLLTPIDWLDLGNSFKSALTLAISNAESRFGVAADYYKKGVLNEQDRVIIEKSIEYILESPKYGTPMQKINLKQEWSRIKMMKGNLVEFHQKLTDLFDISEEAIQEEEKLKEN